MKPSTYKTQNGCYNCKKCFRKMEWDEPDYYFCTLNAKTRPRCGSVFMEEDFGGISHTHSKFRKAYKTWMKWSDKNEVEAWGICDKWERKEIEGF